jgi:hypothetical protein
VAAENSLTSGRPGDERLEFMFIGSGSPDRQPSECPLSDNQERMTVIGGTATLVLTGWSERCISRFRGCHDGIIQRIVQLGVDRPDHRLDHKKQ